MEIGKDNLKNSFREFQWGLWLSLCLLGFAPSVFEMIRTALVSSVSSTELDIIGQMEWFDLMDECLKAFLIVPLYSLLNQLVKKDRKDFAEAVFRSGIAVLFLYAVFCLVWFLYGKAMIRWMNPMDHDIDAINKYLMLEVIAFLIGILPNFFQVVFVVIGKKRNVLVFLFLRILIGIFMDFLLVPKLGVDGIAISNIVSNSVLALSGFVVLALEKEIFPSWFKKGDGRFALDWIRTGLFAGIQQFIDNFIYAIMVVRMVNAVSQPGNYWIANNFIWGWLLVPLSSLSEVMKGDARKVHRKDVPFYFLLVGFLSVLWFVSIPGWEPFLMYCERLENSEEIFRILLMLVPFYVFYALSMVPDSLFIGYGKTQYSMICSALVNFVYYGIWYLIYHFCGNGFDMTRIVLMFGFGMAFHAAISWVEYSIFRRRWKEE